MHHDSSRRSVVVNVPMNDICVASTPSTAGSPAGGDTPAHLQRAQELSRRAAKWLALIRFRSHAAAPSFSESVSHYNVLLSRDAPDAERLESCRTMLVSVRRQLVVEELNANATIATERPTDPYGAEWRITERGAVLHVIADLLSEAIGSFEIALND